MNSMDYRKLIVEHGRHLVVKVGTRLLTDPQRIPGLIAQIAKLRERGFRVILVSSGAVGTGMRLLKLEKRPKKLAEVQALASLGQSQLIALYNDECQKFGFHAAQLLLTADDLRDRKRHLNVSNCLHSLVERNILPIINENDAVSVAELKFGDNDILSALVATMTRAELTVILTTECGLRERVNGVLGNRISVVEKISDTMKASAQGTDNSNLSVGGMSSKLKAAEIVTTSGDFLWVADGRVDNILLKIADGEDVGTLFVPLKPNHLESRKRWIKFFSRRKGRLTIDDGAVQALIKRGKSLLPSGVTGIEGDFKRGDTVEIVTVKGEVIARGLSNYSSEKCRLLAGHKSKDIVTLLKVPGDDELVHRDNMALVGR